MQNFYWLKKVHSFPSIGASLKKNNLVRLYNTAIDMMPSGIHQVIIHADRTTAGEYVRKSYAPNIDEVVIIIVGDKFQPIDIVLNKKNPIN